MSARDPQFLAALRELAPDLIVVAAYGQILPQTLLDVPRLGCLNIHTSLLPRWRGAAPIQWALASGDRETGVTLMRMEAGLDTGPMVASVRTPITDTDTENPSRPPRGTRRPIAGGIHSGLPEGRLAPQPQPVEGVTYACKITRDDGDSIGRNPRRFCGIACGPSRRGRARTASFQEMKHKLLKVHVATPATVPLQTSVTRYRDRIRVDGITVACGSGALNLAEVQPEGGRRMPAGAFVAVIPSRDWEETWCGAELPLWIHARSATQVRNPPHASRRDEKRELRCPHSPNFRAIPAAPSGPGTACHALPQRDGASRGCS